MHIYFPWAVVLISNKPFMRATWATSALSSDGYFSWAIFRPSCDVATLINIERLLKKKKKSYCRRS